MEKDFITKDSGQRQEFNTGSVRDLATGKGRFDLIPTEPLRRLARLYERGAVKYGDRNWELGQPLSRYFDSMMRHLNCLVAGEPEEDHAAAIAWNAFGYMHTLSAIAAARLPKELDNRPAPEAQYVMAPAAVPSPTPPALQMAFAMEEKGPDRFTRGLERAIKQLSFVFEEPAPTRAPFTPQEEQWFRTGEPLAMPTQVPPVEELARCNDPHCQMCPLLPGTPPFRTKGGV